MPDHTCPACPACKVPWRNHAGPISLCEALTEARAEVVRLRAQVDRLTAAKSNPEPLEMT